MGQVGCSKQRRVEDAKHLLKVLNTHTYRVVTLYSIIHVITMYYSINNEQRTILYIHFFIII